MRNRQRHIKSKSLGASVCLDARYISASNNDSISQWDDLSGNSRNATQTNQANKPTFLSDGAGGQPAVYFAGDGGVEDVMAISVPSSRPVSVIAVQWKNASGNRIGSLSDNGDLYAAVYWDDNVIYAEGRGIAGGSFGDGNITEPSICSTITETVDAVFINGSERTRTSIGGAGTNIDFTQIGITYGPNTPNGKLAYVFAISEALSSSLRKLIEHSAAYSWKINCS